jgi:hypothetical protein
VPISNAQRGEGDGIAVCQAGGDPSQSRRDVRAANELQAVHLNGGSRDLIPGEVVGLEIGGHVCLGEGLRARIDLEGGQPLRPLARA